MQVFFNPFRNGPHELPKYKIAYLTYIKKLILNETDEYCFWV